MFSLIRVLAPERFGLLTRINLKGGKELVSDPPLKL